jgi:hypothetical protein
MFFPVGWPRVLNSSEPNKINAVVCNRDKILFAVLTTDALTIWYCKACNLGYEKIIFNNNKNNISYIITISLLNINILITFGSVLKTDTFKFNYNL